MEQKMIVEWLASLSVSSRTMKQYEYAVSRFRYDTGMPLDKTDQDYVLRWKGWLERAKYANKTVNNYVTALKSFLKYHYGKESVNKINVYSREFKKKEVPLTPEIIENMCEKVKKPRDEMIIRLLAETAVEVGELLRIKIEDIDYENRKIKIIGKMGRERDVFVTQPTLSKLKKYVEKRKGGKLFFKTDKGIQWIINRCWENVDGKGKISPYTFRDYFSINFLKNGGKIDALQKILGHVSLNTTKSAFPSFEPDLKAEFDRIMAHTTG